MNLSRGRPTLATFLKDYWTGRILILNTIIFILMTLEGGSLFQPSMQVIIDFGAKESSKLVAGEWWRFVTPVFVHIGLIHFLFNSYAIYILGLQLEPLVGAKYLIPVYFISGFCGNIASAIFTVGISAGASSAIFGLLGCGLVIERAIGRHIENNTGHKPPRGIYTSLVFVNLILGFLIPAIDNAAHMGGLISGMALTYGVLFIMPNKLQKRSVLKGAIIFTLTVGTALYGAYLSQSPGFYFKRAVTLIEKGDLIGGAQDLRTVLADPNDYSLVYEYLQNLRDSGNGDIATKMELIIGELEKRQSN